MNKSSLLIIGVLCWCGRGLLESIIFVSLLLVFVFVFVCVFVCVIVAKAKREEAERIVNIIMRVATMGDMIII